MKNLLKTVRDSIAAAMNGRTIEQMETEQLKQNVKNAVDDYLIRHPDWQPSTKSAPAFRQQKTLFEVYCLCLHYVPLFSYTYLPNFLHKYNLNVSTKQQG